MNDSLEIPEPVAKPAKPLPNGFTLLELLVVMAILALLATIVGSQVLDYLARAKVQAAQVQAKEVEGALQLFRLDVGRFPTNEEGLASLVKAPASVSTWNGPYLSNSSALTDPWGKPYLLRAPGEHGEVDVFSLGSDGTVGGSGEARDVGNWKE